MVFLKKKIVSILALVQILADVIQKAQANSTVCLTYISVCSVVRAFNFAYKGCFIVSDTLIFCLDRGKPFQLELVMLDTDKISASRKV